MITEDYVSFETAKLLKKKGFDEATIGYYNTICEIPERIKFFDSPISIYDSDGLIGCIQAPTLQMVMKWLREVHHIIIEVSPLSFTYKSSENSICNNWVFNLWKDCNPIVSEFYGNQTAYSTYEEACEAAIKYCFKNLI